MRAEPAARAEQGSGGPEKLIEEAERLLSEIEALSQVGELNGRPRGLRPALGPGSVDYKAQLAGQDLGNQFTADPAAPPGLIRDCDVYKGWRMALSGQYAEMDVEPGVLPYGSPVQNLTACVKACEQQPGCQQAVYKESNRACYPMSSAQLKDEDRKGGWNYGFVSIQCGLRACTVYNNWRKHALGGVAVQINVTGRRYGAQLKNWEECQEECLDNRHCRQAVFSRLHRKCELRGRLGFDDQDGKGGENVQYVSAHCVPRACTVFPGHRKADIGNPLPVGNTRTHGAEVASFLECRDACEANPDCLQLVYESNKKTCHMFDELSYTDHVAKEGDVQMYRTEGNSTRGNRTKWTRKRGKRSKNLWPGGDEDLSTWRNRRTANSTKLRERRRQYYESHHMDEGMKHYAQEQDQGNYTSAHCF